LITAARACQNAHNKRKGKKGYPPHFLAIFEVHAQHDGQGHQVDQNGRTTVTHERQGQPLGGQSTQVHTNVDEGLKAHPQGHALGQ
jgi:hypothetical protein